MPLPRVLIVESRGGYTRYFYPSFGLSNQGIAVTYGYAPTDEKLNFDHGESGAQLFRALQNIPGIGFTLTTNQLTVSRKPGLHWNEVEPEVIRVIKEVFGDFKIERESPITRFANWLRRTVIEPLTPSK